MIRPLKAVTQLNHFPEVLRCRKATKQWRRLTAAYLGLPSRLPFSIDLATGPFEFREISDVPTFWQIFYREIYAVQPDYRIIIDAGANIGAFSLYALLRAPQCHVVAVEPAPDTCCRMRAMLLRHGVGQRCTLHEAALGDMAGTTTIQMSAGSQFRQTGGSEGVQVPVVTLASLIIPFKRVDLLKIDTEGAEYKVLSSTTPEVLGRINRIALEYHPCGRPMELFGWLQSCGLSLDTVEDHGGGYGVATLSFKDKQRPLAD